MKTSFSDDIARVQRLDAVTTILDVVCRTTGMGFAAIARVTEASWVACCTLDGAGFGIGAGSELPIETTLCNEVRDHRQPVVIEDVANDPLYRDHRTPAIYGLKSYVSTPIVLADGSFFGTLCAIDRNAAKLKSPAITGMFTLFAQLIGFHLDSQDRLAQAEARLVAEQQEAELREKFVGILGHDLRNPLASIIAGVRLLERTVLEPRAVSILTAMNASAERMSEMVGDVLDFTQARLGGGLPLTVRPEADLGTKLLPVIEELRAGHPGATIEADVEIEGVVTCDAGRISQLLSNLVANAVVHGDGSRPVTVSIGSRDGRFAIAVANAGPPISEAIRADVFKPFVRGVRRGGRDGLGLGLYIVDDIARAHGGRVSVTSTDEETRFVFVMPLSGGTTEVISAAAAPVPTS